MIFLLDVVLVVTIFVVIVGIIEIDVIVTVVVLVFCDWPLSCVFVLLFFVLEQVVFFLSL